LNRAVRAPPICRKPVGLGGKRVTRGCMGGVSGKDIVTIQLKNQNYEFKKFKKFKIFKKL
jgi:hypothetical protein